MDLDGDQDTLLEKHNNGSSPSEEFHPKKTKWSALPKTLSTRLLSGILLLNLVGFIIVIPTILTRTSRSECGSRTDKLLGNIPWENVVFQTDERYVKANSDVETPYNGTLWGDIYPSAWIGVANPQAVSYGSGVSLTEFGALGTTFGANDEGFVIAVMHQIHCVATLKHAIEEFQGKYTSKTPTEHTDHCIEYLRQAIMCFGDTALESPESLTSFPQKVNGDGSVHRCRDWSKLIEAVKERALKSNRSGWLKVWGKGEI